MPALFPRYKRQTEFGQDEQDGQDGEDWGGRSQVGRDGDAVPTGRDSSPGVRTNGVPTGEEVEGLDGESGVKGVQLGEVVLKV